jgi:hypothetical protein
MGVPNRLACEGETLVVHRFRTGTLGLACPSDLDLPNHGPTRKPNFWSAWKDFFHPPQRKAVTAVCIPPGASLMLSDIPPRLQRKLAIGSEEQVIFTQLSATWNDYRDAVRFTSGREVRLQDLQEGQRVVILDLGCTPVAPPLVHEFAELQM